ncbi:MAG: LysE family translocator, partial [Paracoccaceae bacterium]
ARRRARPLRFHEAVAFQWVNPKGWVVAIAVAATYVRGDNPVADAVIIAAIFVIAGLTSSQTWAAFGAAIGQALGTGIRLRAFNAAMGLLLAGCALWLVLDG